MCLAALCGSIVTALALAATAWAQSAAAAPSTAPSLGDPFNALWSLLGSTPVAAVLYAWIRSEKTDRQQERTDRIAATTAKDATMGKMIELIEADISHKVELRQRLKGQDDAIAKLVETTSRIERRLEERRPRREGGP